MIVTYASKEVPPRSSPTTTAPAWHFSGYPERAGRAQRNLSQGRRGAPHWKPAGGLGRPCPMHQIARQPGRSTGIERRACIGRCERHGQTNSTQLTRSTPKWRTARGSHAPATRGLDLISICVHQAHREARTTLKKPSLLRHTRCCICERRISDTIDSISWPARVLVQPVLPARSPA